MLLFHERRNLYDSVMSISLSIPKERGSPRPSRLLIPVNVLARGEEQEGEMWEPVSTAPFDRDLKLAVINGTGIHALVFPCRRLLDGWVKAGTKQRIEISPTHWRDWSEGDGAIAPLQ